MMLKKRFLFAISIVFLISFYAFSAFAEMLYVKPSSEITMRRGKGTDFKIIAVIKDGTPVELLGESEDWAQVRLDSGKEGWVLRRFLSDTPPLGQQVELLQREKDVLTQTSQGLKQRLDQLSGEKDEIEKQLRSEKEQIEKEFNLCVSDRTSINDNYARLQEDTADVVQTKKNLEAAQSKITTLDQQLSQLQEENDRLTKTETLKWFLAGGGVLFLGWLIGLISRGSKKKRSSLL